MQSDEKDGGQDDDGSALFRPEAVHADQSHGDGAQDGDVCDDQRGGQSFREDGDHQAGQAWHGIQNQPDAAEDKPVLLLLGIRLEGIFVHGVSPFVFLLSVYHRKAEKERDRAKFAEKRTARSHCPLRFDSVDILHDLFRRIVQLCGIADDLLEHTEGGGIVVAVADPFVQHEGEVHVHEAH